MGLKHILQRGIVARGIAGTDHHQNNNEQKRAAEREEPERPILQQQ